MKKCGLAAIVLALLAWTSSANASITNVTGGDDGDGVVTCPPEGNIWNDETDTFSINGTHNLLEAGHVLGDIYTDTELDPTLTITNSLENDTGLSWIGYHVNISMNHTFTISNEDVTVPADWSAVITSQPVVVGPLWIGQLDFTAGTPVADTETLAFGYKISFSGKLSYSYCQEMIPVAVPEPATLVLVSCGLVGLFVLRRRSA
jgi:hypothetical protein